MQVLRSVFLCCSAFIVYKLFKLSHLEFKPDLWARNVISPLKRGDFSTQSQYIWNFGAPLAELVPDRVSHREYTKGQVVTSDLYETPRSVLLHEADRGQGFSDWRSILYQAVLFLVGASIMKLYVYPLFIDR